MIKEDHNYGTQILIVCEINTSIPFPVPFLKYKLKIYLRYLHWSYLNTLPSWCLECDQSPKKFLGVSHRRVYISNYSEFECQAAGSTGTRLHPFY